MEEEKTWHDFLPQAQYMIEHGIREGEDDVALAKKLFERWESKKDK